MDSGAESPGRGDPPIADSAPSPSASTFSGNVLRDVPRDLPRRVKDLPLSSKVVGAVVGALLLLTVLSPLGLLAALLLFGASLVGLIVRVGQRRSIKGWGAVAVASFVLALVFGGISNALYGGESVESTGADGGAKDRGAKQKKDAVREEVQDRIVKASQEAPPPKQQVVPDPATKRYNEQVQDYNKQVQESNERAREEEERIRKEEERRRFERQVMCSQPKPPPDC